MKILPLILKKENVIFHNKGNEELLKDEIDTNTVTNNKKDSLINSKNNEKEEEHKKIKKLFI